MDSNWKKYRIPSTTAGVDSIIECTLVEEPDFDDLKTLTEQIESGLLEFIGDVQKFIG